ncbi:MAG TPA: BtaA family protein [Vicinamibacteria bacterium]|nr:BtaA family protein [Vicinamibacteria bacterium]
MTDGGRSSLLSRSFFDLVWRHNIVYNQCWEDPAVDRQALDLRPHDRVLVITSAGCNALDYALLGAQVVAVDANPRQNHLLELKRAGTAALDFDAFFALFGDGGSPLSREIYAALRRELPDDARRFWDREIHLFEPRSGRGTFYYQGTSGFVARLMAFYIDHVPRGRDLLDLLLAAPSLEEQVALYETELRHRLLGEGLLRAVGSRGVLALLGVPGPQREMVMSARGGMAGFLRRSFDHVMSVGLFRDNYFWSVYINGRYTRESCPEYLKRPNFERLKAGLVGNVRSVTATVTQCLAEDEEGFSAFVLLDHMDWLAESPRLLEEEWERIFASARPGARVIFRSGGTDARFLPVSVARRLVFEAQRASLLHLQDRVGTYGSFHIGHLAVA